MAGIIEWFDPEKLYGLIADYDSRQHVFYHLRNVRPDSLGRQMSRAVDEGANVEFDVIRGVFGKPAALDVRPVEPEEPADLAIHRELSTVVRWVRKDGHGVGYVRRASGDWAAFHSKDIITEGADQLSVGMSLWHGISFKDFDPNQPMREPLDMKNIVRCTHIEICQPEPQPSSNPSVDVPKIAVPASVLMSDRLRTVKLRNIRIRKSA